ncbi:MAG TPA: AAA family ATPase [Rhizomicrobium sp.]|jgi:Mrp family chromosome partitioning ATPase
MADRTPDLIQRAAARLQKPALQPDTYDTLPAADSLGAARRQGPQISHVERIGSLETTDRKAVPSRDEERYVTISPTSLASYGIALPSSGFSRTVEEFRALKRHVMTNASSARSASDATPGRIILVTSARPGEGKTFTATNLALALAYEKDARVLLVDADAYRQSLMSCLGISADVGWLDIVTKPTPDLSEVSLKTNVPGLTVLPAGKERSEIPELMSSRHMKKLLELMTREDPGRYIVIDALPCLTSTEPSILAPLAGQTLFVVAAHQTSREDIESSLRLLSASPSVNLVLNKTEPLLTEQFKGYGYSYASQR